MTCRLPTHADSRGIAGCPDLRTLLSFRGRGFTALEMLIALGIFAVGLIAVAAILPVAAMLQKEAVEDLGATYAAENAEAIVRVVKFKESELIDPNTGDPKIRVDGDTDMRLRPVELADFWDDHPHEARSFPANYDWDPQQRQYYWVPLFLNRTAGTGSAPEWVTCVFILARKEGADYGSSGANGSDNAAVPKVVMLDCTDVSSAPTITVS
jgi:prepilin-type N-terminal cleavage/methylation domain-containing protein